MAYTIVAHPTTYNGIRFRSRLEARWAAAFDLLGWQWEYEPFDLDGWVPDFQLTLEKKYNHQFHKLDEGYGGSDDIDVPNPLVEVRPVEPCYVDQDVPTGFDLDRIYRGTKKRGQVLLLGTNTEAAWRIPDMGCWGWAYGVYIPNGESIWRTAGNKVQWRP